MQEIKAIRGVANVESRLWGYYYDSLVGANYTLLVPPNQTEAQQTGRTTKVEMDSNDPHALEETNFYGTQILKHWNIASGEELQLILERKTYLT